MIMGIKKRALHRAKILQGQLKGLSKMIDNEEYCVDVLTQSLAIQKSLASLDKLMLENHLKTHVSHGFRSPSPKEHEQHIDELLKIYELSRRG